MYKPTAICVSSRTYSCATPREHSHIIRRSYAPSAHLHILPRRLLAACLSVALDLAPATGAVVGDHGLEQVQEGALVDRLAFTNLNRPRGFVAAPLIDNTLRIRCDGIVQKHVDMVFGRKQCANVTLQCEVGPRAALDG